MDRGERRDRTENVRRRRVSQWRVRMGSDASHKRAGAARDRSLFACSCRGRKGFCHASPKAHKPLVERRANRFATQWGFLSFDRDAKLWVDEELVGEIGPMVDDLGYESGSDDCECCCCTGECSVYAGTYDAPNFQYLDDVIG